jgi:hypothetical protein
MPKIPLSQVQPDQRLARPVTNASGVVLVQAGTALSAALIHRLLGLGIDTVTVAAEGSDEGEDRPLEERLRELDARFAGHEQDAVMMQIKDAVARQLQGSRSSDNA